MDLCIVTNRLIAGEGQGRVNAEIARHAAESGHRVTCLAHTVDAELRAHPHVSHVQMPNENQPAALPGGIRFAARTTQWLRRNGESFDIVVGNGCNTWYSVDVNIVHFVHSAWRCSPVHDARAYDGPYGWYQYVYSAFNAGVEKRMLPRADVIVAVSKKVKQELIDQGLSKEHVRVIHNGVDLEAFQPGSADRSALGLPEDVPLAFFAGDIRTPRKNLGTVLLALARVDDLHLAVAGDTSGSPFPEQAEQLGVADRTRFLGFRDDVPDLMRAADLFVFPSRYEACSLVLLEALASGLPVVTASTTGGAELVNGEAGVILSDPGDVDRLTRTLHWLVHYPSRRAEMASAARDRAIELSWSRMARRYLNLIARLGAPNDATVRDGHAPGREATVVIP
ncbi:glycosyltransferase family 4 protein [Longibacter sp.]|uniref:glycosyltransferase family 4 protein n=1 Tax=Longibacter sp. TaxID=2045415 RepID=UPI003EC0159A